MKNFSIFVIVLRDITYRKRLALFLFQRIWTIQRITKNKQYALHWLSWAWPMRIACVGLVLFVIRAVQSLLKG